MEVLLSRRAFLRTGATAAAAGTLFLASCSEGQNQETPAPKASTPDSPPPVTTPILIQRKDTHARPIPTGFSPEFQPLIDAKIDDWARDIVDKELIPRIVYFAGGTHAQVDPKASEGKGLNVHLTPNGKISDGTPSFARPGSGDMMFYTFLIQALEPGANLEALYPQDPGVVQSWAGVYYSYDLKEQRYVPYHSSAPTMNIPDKYAPERRIGFIPKVLNDILYLHDLTKTLNPSKIQTYIPDFPDAKG